MKCPSCGTDNADSEEFCTDCGTKLIEEAELRVLPPDEETDEAEETEEETTEDGEEMPTEEELLQLLGAIEETTAPEEPVAPKFPIEVSVDDGTDRGLVRGHNEDDRLVFTREFPNHGLRFDLLIVADGMGGHKYGENAAFLGTQVTMTYVSNGLATALPDLVSADRPAEEIFSWLDANLPNIIRASVQKANEKVLEYGKKNKLESGDLGATIVVAAIVSNLETGAISVHGWNEGDARCSWWNGAELVQLTTDHTMLSAPYRFLGEGRTIGGGSFELKIKPGEFPEVRIIFYSDGLWNMLAPVSAVSVETLIGMAKHTENPAVEGAQPGDDNITIIKWQARVCADIEEGTVEKETNEKEEENGNPEEPTEPAPDQLGSEDVLPLL